jgi:hypothetical protein
MICVRVVVRGIRREEIEDGGHFCNLSVAQRNSKQTYFDLANKLRASMQSCQSAWARDPVSCVVGLSWARIGPVLFIDFSFSFSSRAK